MAVRIVQGQPEKSAPSEIRGLLNIDKVSGCTSHDVVAKLRGALGVRKIGHTGTLDPLATGVLLLCVGTATKAARFLVYRLCRPAVHCLHLIDPIDLKCLHLSPPLLLCFHQHPRPLPVSREKRFRFESA